MLEGDVHQLYGPEHEHHGCRGQSRTRRRRLWRFRPTAIPIAFNVFMHVDVNSKTGEIKVLPPLSKPGNSTSFRAQMDLIVAPHRVLGRAVEQFAHKPIHYRVE